MHGRTTIDEEMRARNNDEQESEIDGVVSVHVVSKSMATLTLVDDFEIVPKSDLKTLLGAGREIAAIFCANYAKSFYLCERTLENEIGHDDGT